MADDKVDRMVEAYLLAAGGDWEAALQTALADAVEGLALATSLVSHGYARGHLPRPSVATPPVTAGAGGEGWSEPLAQQRRELSSL